MTECERIIKNGVLPESFFREEIRNDFLVDVKRKKIWAVEIDLLLEFDRVCKKHGLKYFLKAGSLLGAVRHGGFVPWDDDMDVIMPRADYEKLLLLGEEFSHPYFLQVPFAENGYFYAIARLRNSNTTALDRPFAYQEMNHGIFIDISYLDEIDTKDAKEHYERINKLNIDNSTAMRLSNPSPTLKDIERIKKYDGKDPFQRYEEIQRIARMYQGRKTEKVVCFNSVYGYEKNCWYSCDFASAVFVDFEGMKFPIPCGYERILSTTFGDWSAFPPVKERGAWHGNIVFEPDVPYIEYKRNQGIM